MFPPLYRLNGFDLIVCQGADAEAFLQAQFSNDVRELGVRNAQWNALLSPQGRVMALIALHRVDAQQFALIVAHHRGVALIEALRKFVLRRKLTLAFDPARAVYASEDTLTAGDPVLDGFIALELSLGDTRCLYLGPQDHGALPMPSDWALRDLRAGIPWLPPAASERHLPHALALDKLPAISLKKGCYPGQEIVARTHYLGRSKRILCLLHTPTNTAHIGAGMQLRDGDNQLAGELVDAIVGTDGTSALAVISEERASGTLLAQLENGQNVLFALKRQF